MAQKYIDPVSGFGGQSYQALANIPGVPGGIQNKDGFAGAAQSILTGSQGAQEALLKGYRAQYQQRAEGIAAGQGEMADRLGANAAASGLSPDLIQRMLLGSNAAAERDMGAARGEAESDYQGALAELLKGTGTELAGLKMNELQQVIQAYVASKARAAGQKAAFTGAIGNAVGMAGAAAMPG